ncbi:MAG TPA: signal peptide peptidase SppA, partial [Anaeromyxobacteraceae bacterium]|nr:signal peptide peptidase SppA [Anaeromyxobacteraceae bacterium]
LPTVDLDRELTPRRVLFFSLGDPDPYGTLVGRLEAARDDPDLGAVLVRVDSLPLGAGRVEELRGLLTAIAKRKPVLAYLDGGGTREYWLASAATAVAAPPGAPLLVNGLSTAQLYVRDALARLGISFEVVKAGAYKSATEPLVRDAPSPEAREATEAVLDDVYGRIVGDVAAARHLGADRVRALVDQGLFTSEEARDAGLLDEVLWPDQLEAWGRRVAGRPLHRRDRLRPEPERVAQRWGRPPVIEVIRVEGLIARGRTRREPLGGVAVAGAETVTEQLDRAARDREVRAIVLRIESGGGDGLASDLISRAVARARERGKPVIASMGDLAASGGYLVAAGADAIVAAPSTITGSIGVFIAKPDLSGLLGKLPVQRAPFTRGENAQIASLAKPWTASERRLLERQIGVFYELFVGRVAEGRRLARDQVERGAGGRVWTGRQAMERRLVDRLGTLADAIALARERAGLSPDELVAVRRVSDGAASLTRAVSGAAEALAPEPPLARIAAASPELSALLALAELGPVLALPEAWFTGSAAPSTAPSPPPEGPPSGRQR